MLAMQALCFDPDVDAFPRAPSQAEWDRLTPEERQRVVEGLPSEFEWATPAEGDPHRKAKERAVQALGEHFRRTQRRVYLSSELPVYYPDEPVFAPDVIAVLDVSTHERARWVVTQERRGLDFVLEINHRGRRKAIVTQSGPRPSGLPKKDFLDNIERFHRLRIPEYFAYDIEDEFLLGWRLREDRYETIRYKGIDRRVTSSVLGLDVAVVQGRVCFYHGQTRLPDADELIERLSTMADEAVRRAEHEARRAEDEARRAEDEARRAEDEARRADRLAARLREIGVDPEAVDRLS
jgi:hypothetical protein